MRSCIQFLPVIAAAALLGCATAPPSGEATLSVVTLNIWHDQRDWPARLELIVAELRRLDPDVIALQEVLQHESLPNQAETIARRLGYEYHFSSVDGAASVRRYGNAILTRDPVQARSWRALAPLDDYRTVAHVRVAVAGREIDIYNTHLHHTEAGGEIRREQLGDLLAFIDATRAGGPVLVLGDFNARSSAPELARLGERFADTWSTLHGPDAAAAPTTLNPELGHTARRIDHIYFERGAFQPLHARIILAEPDAAGTWASDHFGLFVQLLVGSGS